MDQGIIVTPNLKLHENIVDNPNHPLREILKDAGRLRIGDGEEGNASWANIKFGPDFAASFQLKRDAGSLMIKQINLYLPRWVYGHNGLAFTEAESFLFGLHRYYEVASLLVAEEDRHRVLPELGSNNASYWSSVEMPVHVPDPDGKLLRAWRNASHPRIESEPAYQSGYVALRGSRLTIKAYDKLAQMSARKTARNISPDLPNFLRIEVTFRGDLLAEYIERRSVQKFECGVSI